MSEEILTWKVGLRVPPQAFRKTIFKLTMEVNSFGKKV